MGWDRTLFVSERCFLHFIICALYVILALISFPLNYLHSLIICACFGCIYLLLYINLALLSFLLHYLCSLWLYLSTVRNSHFLFAPASLSVLSLVVSTLCTSFLLSYHSRFIICALFGCTRLPTKPLIFIFLINDGT